MLPHDQPFEPFSLWLHQAEQAQPRVPNAMQVATVGPGGVPRVRTVLLKQHGPEGFVFYTNLHSRKGQDLAANPNVAACFHWASLERQVLIEGDVQRVSTDDADAYFQSRPRGSQIGAWASHQSREIDSRASLERAVEEQEARFDSGPIPRPPHWSGFRIVPARIEFWQGRADRLHDRTVYHRQDAGWRKTRWQP